MGRKGGHSMTRKEELLRIFCGYTWIGILIFGAATFLWVSL